MHTKAFLPSTPDLSFQKSERLCSKKAFELVFEKGTSIFSFPLKIIYVQELISEPIADKANVQVAFGVSKKNFKRAVKRNKIKRLLREAYRKNKIKGRIGSNIYIFFIYVSKEVLSYKTIETSLIKGLNEISSRIEKNI